MPVQNADVAAVFAEIADLLEIQGENPFRVRAYRKCGTVGGRTGERCADHDRAGRRPESYSRHR